MLKKKYFLLLTAGIALFLSTLTCTQTTNPISSAYAGPLATPSMMTGYPELIYAMPFGISVNVRIDGPGSIYAVCVPAGDATPTALEVINGTRSGGAAALAKTNYNFVSMAPGQIGIVYTSNQLAPAYDMYITVANNLSDAASARTPVKVVVPNTATTIVDVQLWLDASRAASLTTNTSSRVSGWSDLSGQARTFQQPVAGNQPTYSTNGLAFLRPGVIFASNQWMYSDVANSLTLFNSLNGATLFIVNYMTGFSSATLTNVLFFSGAGATANPRVILQGVYSNPTYQYWNGGRVADGDNTSNYFCNQLYPGDPTLLTTMFDYTLNKITIHLNGSDTKVTNSFQAAVGPTAGTSCTRVYLGIDPAFLGARYLFVGAVSEVIIYRRVLSTPERVLIDSYLKAKWGL